MQRFLWSKLSDADKSDALARPAAISDASLMNSVRDILQSVKTGGDQAVLDLTEKFDGVRPTALRVNETELKSAWDALPAKDKAAIDRAKANIETFHTAQLPDEISIEIEPGVSCRRIPRALDVVGLYVPGGTAPLVSTLLMLAVPAKVAGCSRRVVISPPSKDGTINSTVLAAAYRCDVTDVFIAGGAQAIAALAYGTDAIPKCAKIFGPGNAWVAAAKSIVAQEAGGPAIDMPAGPSEAMVLADADANPAFVASDLLSQAEHDKVAQVICVASSPAVADAVDAAIASQLATLPRKDIATASLGFGRMIIANSRTDILEIINAYAPEHLIIQLDNPKSYVVDIQNAGSIFLGPYTPESVGDYASGTNHTLPTYGAARAYSGITTESFMKYISVQSLTAEGMLSLGPTVERLAELEGLDAHRRAVTLRLESLK
ncbi:histidinol dehydrogenase [Litorimonas sp. RW-G-Af-16]|uniref:histidinol dehydrogenase n=1 Tax=Litorimonas sp. RW-G-Af-16 TaxID=3241168 RepID=UPI00390CC432